MGFRSVTNESEDPTSHRRVGHAEGSCGYVRGAGGREPSCRVAQVRREADDGDEWSGGDQRTGCPTIRAFLAGLRSEAARVDGFRDALADQAGSQGAPRSPRIRFRQCDPRRSHSLAQPQQPNGVCRPGRPRVHDTDPPQSWHRWLSQLRMPVPFPIIWLSWRLKKGAPVRQSPSSIRGAPPNQAHPHHFASVANVGPRCPGDGSAFAVMRAGSSPPCQPRSRRIWRCGP
jgi:hypothetical protein